ncbi:MAG: hypothetical protein LM590_10705 [Thermofilum sp.]|nr:hypothetical protein [Thermofilum sp.]
MRERAFEPRSSRYSLTALRRASQLKTRKGGLSGLPGSLSLEMQPVVELTSSTSARKPSRSSS